MIYEIDRIYLVHPVILSKAFIATKRLCTL